MFMKKLKKLDDIIPSWSLTNDKPRPNGFECPKCGEELYDTNPMLTLMSYPPKKSVNCEKCGYTGYIFL